MKKQWVIPPTHNSEFVCRMEDVLDLYHRPYDSSYPMVCMDETSKQLVAHTRRSIPAKPGQPERYDYEYERNGVVNLFMFFEPLGGVRHVKVTKRRTRADWAECMAELVNVHYPKARVIEVVLDNLNTHNPAALYEIYEPAEARRILRRLRFHFTPKHGSWLNMAEIELSAMGRQCLSGRIADSDTLISQVAAWEQSRNGVELKMDWRFTSSDARIKLKRLYPLIQD